MQNFVSDQIFDWPHQLSDFYLISYFSYLILTRILADHDARERKMNMTVTYLILLPEVPLTLILNFYNKILKKKKTFERKKIGNILKFFCFFLLFYLMIKQSWNNMLVHCIYLK